MGILNALSTAVTGLSAQSYALENISGNIANSQTVGFKRVDTSFVDLIPDQPARQEVAGSVGAYSQLTNTIQAPTRSTGVNTNMALNGDGFFVVQENTGSSASPTFTGRNLFTRRGDFQTDSSGYLVNASGKYLVGSSAGQGNAPIRISTTPIAAKRTETITYQGNVPSYPKTAAADPSVPGSELLSAALAANPAVSADDTPAFMRQTISGGELTAYDQAGKPVTMQLRWGKTANAAANGGAENWSLFYESNASATGAGERWTEVGDFSFTSTGKLTSAPNVTIPNLTVNGTSMGSVDLDFGGGRVTQYADATGEVGNANIQQDGYTTGTLTSVGVTSDGRVVGNYSNGQISTISQVLVAKFNAGDSLERLTGGAYGQTTESGAPVFGLQGTTIAGGSVEMSNTDISDEFSKMIVTQQAYSANTRVMSTAQQMLQDVINVIR